MALNCDTAGLCISSLSGLVLYLLFPFKPQRFLISECHFSACIKDYLFEYDTVEDKESLYFTHSTDVFIQSDLQTEPSEQ